MVLDYVCAIYNGYAIVLSTENGPMGRYIIQKARLELNVPEMIISHKRKKQKLQLKRAKFMKDNFKVRLFATLKKRWITLINVIINTYSGPPRTLIWTELKYIRFKAGTNLNYNKNRFKWEKTIKYLSRTNIRISKYKTNKLIGFYALKREENFIQVPKRTRKMRQFPVLLWLTVNLDNEKLLGFEKYMDN